MKFDVEQLISSALAWREQDPDPITVAELDALIAAARTGDGPATIELHDRFRAPLQFGTAGLRARLGAGPARMNRVVVAQAAAGLAAHLLGASAHQESAAPHAKPSAHQESAVPQAAPSAHQESAASDTAHTESAPSSPAPLVVIGYDGRRNSDVFARDSAEILAGAGLRALLLPRALPTPLLAFAVRHLGADAGVMVTASHNPPFDNGYKVYLGAAAGSVEAGAQIVAPTDAAIAERIARVAERPITDLPRSAEYATAGEDVIDAYVAACARAAAGGSATGDAATGDAEEPALRWVYTAMHGVGAELMLRAAREAGLPEPAVVEAQRDPDPDFPTVPFPNPEEPGAMDLAFALAAEHRADVVIANDPDADRLGVGIPMRGGENRAAVAASAAGTAAGTGADTANGATAAAGFRRLSGNEVGLLLAWQAAKAHAERRAPGGTDALAASLVSSPALGEIAARYGLAHHETLTGFKWIGRTPNLVFGFEEALGYLVNPDDLRDKDGISAAIALLRLAAHAHARHRTVQDLLDEFTTEFGHFASGQVSLRLEHPREAQRLSAALRANPPARVGDDEIVETTDFRSSESASALPPADMIRYRLASGARVIVRPSGTEPKLKVYLDARAATSEEAAARIAQLDADVRELLAQF